MSWPPRSGGSVAALMASEGSSGSEGGSESSGRGRLVTSIVAVTALGFGTGLGIAWLTSASDDDVTVAAPEPSTTSTSRSTPIWPSSIPTSVVETTTTTEATTTTTTAVTTTTEPTSTTTVTTTSTTAPIVPQTTATTLPEPWPVPTSVPSSPPGTPADLRVAYPGQASGVLRIRLGQDSQMVVSNVGGSQVRWRAVAAGGIAIGGQQTVEVVLMPGQSAALPLRTHQVGQASITVTSPTQVLVVPVEIN